MSRLSGKIAVTTGTASGVGRASALLFAREGAEVICVDIDDKLNAETVTLVEAAGGVAIALRTDLGNPAQIGEMAAECMRLRPRIDILFNNAGILDRQSFGHVEIESWQRHLAINLTAPFLCSQLLLPALRAAGKASIIHNGSIDGVLGNPTAVSYSASKGGLVPLTHVMAHALAPDGIRINCIHSGAIMTSDNGVPVRLTPELKAGRSMSDIQRKATPLGRPGTVEELASVALFLACDDSSYMTGSIITMDGGRTGITPGTAS